MITGWGANTNVKRDVKDNQRILGVGFPTLLQVVVPVANSKCSKDNEFRINEKLQICAGGEKGNLKLTKIAKKTRNSLDSMRSNPAIHNLAS